MEATNNNAVRILLVDDDEDDQFMIKKIFKTFLPSAEIIQAFNGEECMVYLQNCNGNFPTLITLDLNMPLLNGIETISKIKNNQNFKDLVTIILSTSDRETEKRSALENGASDYFVKPVEYDKLKEIIKTIIDKWL